MDTHKSALLLALIGFALLSVGDALVKSMVGMWPGIAIGALRYVVGTCGLGVALLVREGRAGFRFPQVRWQIVRGASVAISAMAFFTAVQVMSISEATAIAFTSPMITALLAAMILREPLRHETWIASGVAFAGVLVILRPNFVVLGPAALLPVVSAVGMAMLMIANRKVAGTGSALAMQFNVAFIGSICLLSVTIGGHLVGFDFMQLSVPAPSVVLKSSIIAVTASTAHALIYIATTRAGPAAIAPMTYVQLLMAGMFGWVLFGERPDLTAAIGSVVIVGAGLYLWRAGSAPPEPAMTD